MGTFNLVTVSQKYSYTPLSHGLLLFKYPKGLNLIVGSGGVISHAPRREQAFRMLIDSFLPEGITQIAVDSIFMMPQLGVLSSIHEDAAIEVFNKDCLVRLGSCIAPTGSHSNLSTILDYEIKLPDETIKGQLKFGEIKIIKCPYKPFKCIINTHNNLTINDKTFFEGEVFGGEIGILLDGRGRPFTLNLQMDDRKQFIKDWSTSTNEYPD